MLVAFVPIVVTLLATPEVFALIPGVSTALSRPPGNAETDKLPMPVVVV